MSSNIFSKVYKVKLKRKYTGKILRPKPGKRGYFPLPSRARLPKRLLINKQEYNKCIEASTDTAEDIYAQRVEIKYISKAVGYGVFAKEDIPRGIVGIYTGVLKKVPGYSKNRYLFSFTVKILADIMIDGEKKGNWTALLNHSPWNRKVTNLVVKEYFYKGLPYILFYAPKKIKKGAQLLYDYGSSYWDSLDVDPKKF